MRRVCDICKSPLAGPKNHGFVVAGGKSVICGDWRRHDRIKRRRKYNYEEEVVLQQWTLQEEEGKEVLTQ
jgi:hypothetical protein